MARSFKSVLFTVTVIIAVSAIGYMLFHGRFINSVKSEHDGSKQFGGAAAPMPERSASTDGASSQRRAQLLPEPGAPLKMTIYELKARASSGDAAAASRLFEDLKTCVRVRNIEKIKLENTLRALDSGQLKATDAALVDMQEQMDFVKSNAVFCAGVDGEEISDMVPATLRAAQLGDTGATDCYVAMGIFGVGAMPGLTDHPEWLSQYKQNVIPLAQSAISKGDWNVVTMLHSAYSSEGANANLLSQVTGADPMQAYKYLKLLDSGVVGGNEHWQERLTELANQIGRQAQTDADAWAQKTYREYFRSNPISSMKGPMSCRMI